MTSIIKGQTLVRGSGEAGSAAPLDVLYSTTSLSFWGGIDPITGVVIDKSHPLEGECVAGTILCLPSGRGSCTGSQVLLELILNGIAPAAIVTRDIDPILCVGAIIAEEVFGNEVEANIPTIVHLGEEGFHQMSDQSLGGIVVDEDGSINVAVSTCQEDIDRILKENVVNVAPSHNCDGDISALELSDEEEAILTGRKGTAADQVALRTICRIASITNSPKLIPVTQAHIDGCTYIGPGGLRFVEKLVELGGKVSVPTTLNSVSADRRRWEALGVSSDLATPANQVGDAYLKLGCTESFTCAPYLLPSRPALGDDIVWGESNAVVFSNSVLGARTDKVADYADICSALVGRVPYSGMHIDELRLPGIVIDVEDIVEQNILPSIEEENSNLDSFFPVFGYLVGNLSDGRIPIVIGMESLQHYITSDDLKSFCAAFGTSGTAPICHIAAVTPEAKDPHQVDAMIKSCNGKSVTAQYNQLVSSFNQLDSGGSSQQDAGRVDLVSFGNPHLSLQECKRLSELVSKAPDKDPNVKVMATLSRHVYDQANSLGYVAQLESFGVQFINDTCWCMLVDAPIIPVSPTATIMTNSGKYAHYGPGLTNRRMRFGSMTQCIEAATVGVSSGLKPPSWLAQKRGLATLLLNCASRGRAGRLA